MSQILSGQINLLTDPAIAGGPLLIRFGIENRSQKPVIIKTFNAPALPEHIDPDCSLQTYNISILISSGLIDASMYGPGGEPIDRQIFMPWINPLLTHRLLRPGERFDMTFDLAELFQLAKPGTYRAEVCYSDGDVVAEGVAQIEVGTVTEGTAT